MFINCTLKKSPEISNTHGLVDISVAIMRKHGVEVDEVAGDLPACTRQRHPGPRRTDLARIKHCAQNVLYSLQHIGFTIPPQADAGWIGAAGPGPSYLDPGSGGPENDFTNRNTTFVTWNLMHLASRLQSFSGIPAYGNRRSEWKAAARFDFESPEYR